MINLRLALRQLHCGHGSYQRSNGVRCEFCHLEFKYVEKDHYWNWRTKEHPQWVPYDNQYPMWDKLGKNKKMPFFDNKNVDSKYVWNPNNEWVFPRTRR